MRRYVAAALLAALVDLVMLGVASVPVRAPQLVFIDDGWCYR